MGQRGISSPVYVEDGVYLWSPPAAAVDVAIEQSAKARHRKFVLLIFLLYPVVEFICGGGSYFVRVIFILISNLEFRFGKRMNMNHLLLPFISLL